MKLQIKTGVKLDKASHMPLDFMLQEIEICLLGGNTVPGITDAL